MNDFRPMFGGEPAKKDPPPMWQAAIAGVFVAAILIIALGGLAWVAKIIWTAVLGL